MLLPYDVAVNKAHVLGLLGAGVITNIEKDQLHQALDEVLVEAEEELSQSPDDEDVHSFVERLVVQKVGDLGRKCILGNLEMIR